MSKFRIKTVSRITNIPTDTIRNWEKRYQFLKPSLGTNGEKLYSEQDIDLLRKISFLLKTGGRISEIASQVLSGHGFDNLPVGAERIGTDVRLMIEDYYQFLLVADLTKIDQMESLIEITVLFKNRIEFIYGPLLERVREDCARGLIDTVQEHFVTVHILNKMRGFLSSSIFNHRYQSTAIVCATPSPPAYEGGLLILACSMKLKGHNIYYLGPNTPSDQLRNYAEKIKSAVIAISVHSSEELDTVIRVFKDFARPVFVGGMGVRTAEIKESKIGSVHLITQAGSMAAERLELLVVEFANEA